jgi:hypothetical protein
VGAEGKKYRKEGAFLIIQVIQLGQERVFIVNTELTPGQVRIEIIDLLDTGKLIVIDITLDIPVTELPAEIKGRIVTLAV